MEGITGCLLGLDYGDRRVGVSVCDELGLLAHGVETIHRKRSTKLRGTLSRIEALCEERQIGGIVLGLPLLEDGTEGVRCERTREFGRALSDRLGLPIFYQDERLTTVEAYEWMKESGMDAVDREKQVDEVSAVIILQDFLDNHN